MVLILLDHSETGPTAFLNDLRKEDRANSRLGRPARGAFPGSDDALSRSRDRPSHEGGKDVPSSGDLPSQRADVCGETVMKGDAGTLIGADGPVVSRDAR